MIIYYCITVGKLVNDVPEYNGNWSLCFVSEVLLFAAGLGLPYLYAGENRQGNISPRTITESILLFVKVGFLHIILQYSGFYNQLGL